MRKIIPVLLLILIIFTGCSPQKEPGAILTTDNDEPIILAENTDEMLFYGGEKPDLEFETYNDYYAGFSIPYPKDWALRVGSPNYIAIYNGTSMIVIHHKLLATEVDWEDNVQIFRDSFQSMIDSERFTVGDYSNIYRRPRQTLDDITIVNEYPPLISERYDNIKMTTGLGDYISGKLSEKRYCLRYNTIDTVISVVSLTNNKDEAYKILDYMVGNIRTVGIEYESSGQINTELVNIKIPSSFKRNLVELDELSGFSYAPSGNDALAGCFIQIYPYMETVDYDFVDKIFRSTITDAKSCTYNESKIQNFDIGLDGVYCTSIVTDGTSNSIAQKGTAWNIEIYPTEDSTLVVGYPIAKGKLIKKLSEYVER